MKRRLLSIICIMALVCGCILVASPNEDVKAAVGNKKSGIEITTVNHYDDEEFGVVRYHLDSAKYLEECTDPYIMAQGLKTGNYIAIKALADGNLILFAFNDNGGDGDIGPAMGVYSDKKLKKTLNCIRNGVWKPAITYTGYNNCITIPVSKGQTVYVAPTWDSNNKPQDVTLTISASFIENKTMISVSTKDCYGTSAEDGVNYVVARIPNCKIDEKSISLKWTKGSVKAKKFTGAKYKFTSDKNTNSKKYSEGSVSNTNDDYVELTLECFGIFPKSGKITVMPIFKVGTASNVYFAPYFIYNTKYSAK